MEHIVTGSVLILLLSAVWMDLRFDRISNRLILLGLAFGLPYQLIAHGAGGLTFFLGNTFLTILFFYPCYRIRALGAGDVKLLSMLGVFLSYHQYFKALWYIFAAAAIIGMLKLLRNRILFARLKSVLSYAGQTLLTGTVLPYGGNGRSDDWSNRIHFSVPVLLGYIWYLGRCYLA